MNVLTIEEESFYVLVDTVVSRIKQQQNTIENLWLHPEEAMKRLGIKSPTTLSKLRSEGKIRFSQPSKKIILYDWESINQFLNQHAKNQF